MKKALLVGIENIPGAELHGSLNDICLFYQIFQEQYHFEHFWVLDNERATKNRWLDGLQWLVADAQPGDTLVHYYSGHGTQVPCNTRTIGYELDGLDECPVPYDMDWKNPLRDDDINQFIMQVPPGVKMIFIMDCCRSGTILRNALPKTYRDRFRNRFLAPPLELTLTGKVGLGKGHTIQPLRAKRTPFIVPTLMQAEALLLSGAADYQNGMEGEIEPGRSFGFFSYILAETLQRHHYHITYRNLVTKANKGLRKLNIPEINQTPQLEGREELFGGWFLE